MSNREKAFKKYANRMERPYNEHELDVMYDKGNLSARYRLKKGSIIKYKVLDCVVFPINICAHCGSEKTYHKHTQSKGSKWGNVWRVDRERYDDFVTQIRKWDFCFSCQNEFLIEIFTSQMILDIKRGDEDKT